LYEALLNGMKAAAAEGVHVDAIGIDTWGLTLSMSERMVVFWAVPGLTEIPIPKENKQPSQGCAS
jgi:hypothetical protein